MKNSLYWCETLINADSLEYIWLWVAIEPESKRILGFGISKEQNMLIAEKFLSENTEMSVASIRGINIHGGTWYPPQAHHFLKAYRHLHSPFEKSIIIERTIQYIKDRSIGCFYDFFLCKRKEKCKLKQVINWFNLFTYFHNKEISVKWTEPFYYGCKFYY